MRINISKHNHDNIIIKFRDGALFVTAPSGASLDDVSRHISKYRSEINRLTSNSTRSATNPLIESSVKQVFDDNILHSFLTFKNVLIDGIVHSVVGDNVNNPKIANNYTIIIPIKNLRSKQGRLYDLRTVVRRHANELLPSLIADIGESYAVCPRGINIADLTKDLWYDRRKIRDNCLLSFDFRVIQLPPLLQRFVIANAFDTLIRYGNKKSKKTFESDNMLWEQLNSFAIIKDIL